jgi:hypothetical protein
VQAAGAAVEEEEAANVHSLLPYLSSTSLREISEPTPATEERDSWSREELSVSRTSKIKVLTCFHHDFCAAFVVVVVVAAADAAAAKDLTFL